MPKRSAHCCCTLGSTYWFSMLDCGREKRVTTGLPAAVDDRAAVEERAAAEERAATASEALQSAGPAVAIAWVPAAAALIGCPAPAPALCIPGAPADSAAGAATAAVRPSAAMNMAWWMRFIETSSALCAHRGI